MPELHWPRRSHFRGDAVDVVGPATVEVPDDAVEHLRSRGWVDPPDADDDDAGEDDATAEEGAESEPEPESTDDEGATDAFDAAAFVDRPWQTVASEIGDGAVDEHLDAVEAAEQDRDSPRSSVLNTIAEQR